jgi:hypothetical protein
MIIWRLQTNTDTPTGEKIAQLCLDYKIMALGWSLKDEHLPGYGLSADELADVRKMRSMIKTFSDYQEVFNKYPSIYKGRANENVRRLANEVEVDDLVWMRLDGIYYLGRVCDGSKWQYSCDEHMLTMDAANQRTAIDWQRVGDESAVPGAVSTSMIRGKTLQRIKKEGILGYSQLLYNSLVKNDYYKNVHLPKTLKTFYSLLSTEDCEDLLCAWLYSKYGYVAIPSTNKKSTELYECVLKDPVTGKRIYPQVKDGDIDIDANLYAHLDGEVWLFTVFGRILNLADQERIKTVDADVLYKFVQSKSGNNVLPDSIIKWYQFIEAGK